MTSKYFQENNLIELSRRNKISKAVKERWKDPKFKEGMSETMKKLWKNPAYRKRANKGKKGRKFSLKARKNMSLAAKGRIISESTREKISESVKKLWKDTTYREKASKTMKKMWQDPIYRKIACKARKGRKTSIETKRKLSFILKGKRKPPFSKEHLLKLSLAKKGKSHPPPSIETRMKISLAQKGEKNRNWKGGITNLNKKIRFSIKFRLWRETVFARDNWTCQKCLVKGGKLAPHHIQNFSKYPELRFIVKNGITFCTKCHIIFHKIYGHNNNNERQIKEFLGKNASKTLNKIV